VTSSVPTISPAGRRLPRTWDAAKAAWMDLYRVFRNLPRVWAVALAINFGFSVPALLMHGNVSTGAWILTLLFAVAKAFLLTPYYIAVHRLIILDETAQSYVLRPREPRFQKFFGWSLILSAGMALLVLVFGLPLAFLLQVLALTGANVLGIGIGASFIVICALIFTFFWAMARLSILFPAIAVDAAGANLRNVMADTRGGAWQIFLIGLLAYVPVLVIDSVFAVGIGTVVTAVIDNVVGIVSMTLFVVIASRLYQRLGNRVNQPAVA
jgi:hypothetical protein